MESQYPCSLEFIEDSIKAKEAFLEHLKNYTKDSEDLVTILNLENRIEKTSKEINILYDYAHLRFGTNLKIKNHG